MLVNGKVKTVGMARKIECIGNTSLHPPEIVYLCINEMAKMDCQHCLLNLYQEKSRSQKLLHLFVTIFYSEHLLNYIICIRYCVPVHLEGERERENLDFFSSNLIFFFKIAVSYCNALLCLDSTVNVMI